MTIAETALRERLNRQFPTYGQSVIIDELLEALKLEHLYISDGNICQVVYNEWLDWEDSVVYRSIGHEDPEPEYSEELEDDDEG